MAHTSSTAPPPPRPLRRRGPSRRTGSRLARAVRAASVVVAAATGLGLVLAGCGGGHPVAEVNTTTTAAPTTTTTEAPLTAGRQLTTYVPSVGDCFDHRTIGTGATASQIVLLLPCALPHQNQVYAVLAYPPSPAFPGTGVLEAYAKAHCVAGFQAYVGKPYETSVYGLDYELPTAASWSNGIHHVLGCLLVDANGGRLVGTAQGSAK